MGRSIPLLSLVTAIPRDRPRPFEAAAAGPVVVRHSARGILSTPFHKYDHVCGEGFLAQTRRERRAYPSGVWKERATTSGPKRTAARRVAPHLASGFVAPRSQSAGGYAPSSRLARSQMRRNKRGRIYETGYLAYAGSGASGYCPQNVGKMERGCVRSTSRSGP